MSNGRNCTQCQEHPATLACRKCQKPDLLCIECDFNATPCDICVDEVTRCLGCNNADVVRCSGCDVEYCEDCLEYGHCSDCRTLAPVLQDPLLSTPARRLSADFRKLAISAADIIPVLTTQPPAPRRRRKCPVPEDNIPTPVSKISTLAKTQSVPLEAILRRNFESLLTAEHKDASEAKRAVKTLFDAGASVSGDYALALAYGADRVHGRRLRIVVRKSEHARLRYIFPSAEMAEEVTGGDPVDTCMYNGREVTLPETGIDGDTIILPEYDATVAAKYHSWGFRVMVPYTPEKM